MNSPQNPPEHAAPNPHSPVPADATPTEPASGGPYLALERAGEFIADAGQLREMLALLLDALERDVPQIQAELERGELKAAHERLHAFKGYTPVFCVDALAEQVVQVEGLTRALQLEPARQGYAQLAPKLRALRDEVAAHLAATAP